MSRIYPVSTGTHDEHNDIPAGDRIVIGLFTAAGYWFDSDLTFDLKDQTLANAVEAAINKAYEDGRKDMQREFRLLIGALAEDDE